MAAAARAAAAEEAEEELASDPLKGRKTEAELEEAEDEDEFGDDREPEALRRRRLMELRKAAAANRFGSLRTITRAEYVAEVTKGSDEGADGVWVVLHMFSPRVKRCAAVDECLAVLAARHKSIKFLRIEAAECVPGYPDRNCPSLLVYHKGEAKANLIGGAAGHTLAGIAANLVTAGALDAEEAVVAASVTPGASSSAMARMAAADLGDDDDDDL